MRELFHRFASFFRQSRDDRELDAEVESHIAFATDEYTHRGMTPEEARRQARFGSADARPRRNFSVTSVPCPGWNAWRKIYVMRYARWTRTGIHRIRDPDYRSWHWRECNSFQRIEHGTGAARCPFMNPIAWFGYQTRARTKAYPARHYRYAVSCL